MLEIIKILFVIFCWFMSSVIIIGIMATKLEIGNPKMKICLAYISFIACFLIVSNWFLGLIEENAGKNLINFIALMILDNMIWFIDGDFSIYEYSGIGLFLLVMIVLVTYATEKISERATIVCFWIIALIGFSIAWAELYLMYDDICMVFGVWQSRMCVWIAALSILTLKFFLSHFRNWKKHQFSLMDDDAIKHIGNSVTAND